MTEDDTGKGGEGGGGGKETSRNGPARLEPVLDA